MCVCACVCVHARVYDMTVVLPAARSTWIAVGLIGSAQSASSRSATPPSYTPHAHAYLCVQVHDEYRVCVCVCTWSNLNCVCSGADCCCSGADMMADYMHTQQHARSSVRRLMHARAQQQQQQQCSVCMCVCVCDDSDDGDGGTCCTVSLDCRGTDRMCSLCFIAIGCIRTITHIIHIYSYSYSSPYRALCADIHVPVAG